MRSRGRDVRRGCLLILTVLSGCGYRFSAPLSSLPGGLTSVRVPVFANQSAEPTVELIFTQAAQDQLERAGRLGGEGADGVLEGTILSVGSAPFLTSPELPRQPVFRLVAGVRLVLTRGGRVVASAEVSATEEFPSGADVLLTESNRSAALRRIAESALREGWERLQSPR